LEPDLVAADERSPGVAARGRDQKGGVVLTDDPAARRIESLAPLGG
jgi:hypothetical protein